MGVKARTVSIVVTLGVLAACPAKQPDARPDEACRRDGMRRTVDFVRKNHGRYVKARDGALAYLDGLVVDPVALRQQGLKGKKKLVELLDAHVALHRHARGPLREALEQRFRRAAAPTERSEYHDLASANEKQLRQDATSYLRALYLMDRMGVDTERYRREAQKIKALLDAHLAGRGAHQRMAFAWYYLHLGWELPPALKAPAARSVIASRPNPYLVERARAYQVTHEVFIPFDYGGKLDARPFDATERAYLRHALAVLTTVNLARRDVDLVGELLACMRYLGDHDQRVYRDGLHFLLSSQRPNGAFGDYEALRGKHGDRVEVGLYLHTTSVAMDILPLAFEGP